MSATVSFKVPRHIKEKMAELSSKVRWPEELREYLAQRIKQIEREKIMEEAEELLKNVRPAPEGMSARLLREVRDSH